MSILHRSYAIRVAAEDASSSDNGSQYNSTTEGETNTDGPTGPSKELPTESSEPTATGYELPLDQLFEILKNSRRRETVRYLKANDGETTLSETAEHIAALENDTTVRAITSAQRKRVYVGLYQCHLPKMDDTRIINFDQNRGTIELGPNASQLDPYLDDSDDPRWHKLYLSVAVSGGMLFAVGEAGGAQFGLTPTAVLLALLAGITSAAVWHTMTIRA